MEGRGPNLPSAASDGPGESGGPETSEGPEGARPPDGGQFAPEGDLDPHDIWRKTLHELALQMPQTAYETWVRGTSVMAFEDGEFIIGAPHAYSRDWLEARLRNKIKQILSQLTGRSAQVKFTVRAEAPTRAAGTGASHRSDPMLAPQGGEGLTYEASDGPAQPAYDGPGEAGARPEGMAAGLAGSPLEEEGRSAARPRFPAAGTGASHRADPMLAPQSAKGGPNLPSGASDGPGRDGGVFNPRYTFDSFVVGNHNRLAHAAAQSIVEQPGHRFNPLFVYGGVGLGKTHLLHAIGHAMTTKGMRVLYCSSEQFTNDLISAIRQQSTEEFRNTYRQVGLLLIDDIQFIGGKESTQEEFFHTFNHLHAAGRQVVISSDRPPKEIATLEARLRSRFEGGLQADITQPDLETRVAILQSKAQSIHLTVSVDVLMLIAERVESNIRELEGALNRLIVQAPFYDSQLDRLAAEEILDALVPQRRPREAASVVKIVARQFNLTEQDLRGRKRTKEIAGARQMAMYLLREENGLSLIHIGELLGGRDHSTVRHGVEKVAQDVERDEGARRQLVVLREKIYEPPGTQR